MGRTFTVSEIRERFGAVVASGRPVIGASASSGLVAKSAAAGGADMIIIYSTGLSRVMGLGTEVVYDGNNVTFAMHEEVWSVVDIPIIAGLDAKDPHNWDLNKLLDKFQAAGASGFIHNPRVSVYGTEFAQQQTAIGHGMDREYLLTRLANERGMYCLSYAGTAEYALEAAEAGAHCVIAHVGGTGGGLEPIPHKEADEAVAKVNEILGPVMQKHPDLLFLAHGGPFADPESTLDLYRHTDAQGYIGASSVERTPVERALMDTARAFKSVPLRSGVQ